MTGVKLKWIGEIIRPRKEPAIENVRAPAGHSERGPEANETTGDVRSPLPCRWPCRCADCRPWTDKKPTFRCLKVIWSRQYGIILATFTVTNKLPFPCKRRSGFECDFYAKSGTKLATKQFTIYDIFPG